MGKNYYILKIKYERNNMTIFTGTFIPYVYQNKYDALEHVVSRCHGIKKSLRLIKIDNEHLEVRCPLSGDYLEITGSENEIIWMDKELRKREWYRTS